VLYKIIAKHKNPRDLYADKLMADGIIDATCKSLEKEYKADLEMNLEASRKKDLTIITPFMKMNGWVLLRLWKSRYFLFKVGQHRLLMLLILPTDKSLSIKFKVNQR
jgi:2-oxoglutarate dehydrogenase E1 component